MCISVTLYNFLSNTAAKTTSKCVSIIYTVHNSNLSAYIQVMCMLFSKNLGYRAEIMPSSMFSPGLFAKNLQVSVLSLVDFKPIVPSHFLKKLHKQRERKAKTMSSMSVS